MEKRSCVRAHPLAGGLISRHFHAGESQALILVAGSLALDRVQHCVLLPEEGGDVPASATIEIGALGGMEALAARRAGAAVEIAAAVGDDPDARALGTLLARSGIAAHLARHEGCPTGTAATIAADDGRYLRATAAAANALFEAGEELLRLLDRADILLAQCEANPRATQKLLAAARERRVRTILHAAPARGEALKVLAPLADLTIAGGAALALLASQEPSAGFADFSESALHALPDAKLAALCTACLPGSAVIDLGPRGAFVSEREAGFRLVTGPATFVAGPCRAAVFAGSLAAELDAGGGLRGAALYALHAAALAGGGTQEAIPPREAVTAALAKDGRLP